MPPKFIRRYEEILTGKVQEDNDPISSDVVIWNTCIQRMKNIAVVRFQIESKKLIRIKRTQRVTFADKLSNIGREKKYEFTKTHINITKYKNT